jgi:predicted RecA/RadA family phage recombinase
MKNFVQEGKKLDLTAPRDLSSGDPFIIGAIFAVASGAAKNGTPVVGTVEGVFDLPAKSTTTFAVGDKVSFDNTNHWCDVPAAGFYPIGVAVTAGTAGTVRVKLAEVPTATA